LAGLSFFARGEVRFAYPFEFDAQTRLRSATAHIKGEIGAAKKERERLLAAAEENFEKALQRDRGYAAALVNMAAVSNLQGERDNAILYVNRAIEQARKNNDPVDIAAGLVVRGIMRAEENRNDEASADFSMASSVVPHLAATNQGILRGSFRIGATSGGSRGNSIPELVGGLSPRSTFVKNKDDMSFSLEENGDRAGSIAVHFRNCETWDDTVIISDGKLVRLMGTGKSYKGKTAKGIVIGAQLNDVSSLYGEPDRVLPSRQGIWQVYDNASIIFSLDSGLRVTGWVVFAKE
jgi:tetratricopeptide (TPR) repeat protein